MVSIVATLAIACSAVQQTGPTQIVGLGPASDGFYIETANPTGEVDAVVLRCVSTDHELLEEVFTSPFWRKYLKSSTRDEFIARNKNSKYAKGPASRIGKDWVAKNPISVDLRKLVLPLGEVSSVETLTNRKARFTFSAKGSGIVMKLGTREYPFGLTDRWPLNAQDRSNLFTSADGKDTYGMVLLSIPGESLVPRVLKKSSGHESGFDLTPFFAAWDSMTFGGDYVDVAWDSSWALADRCISATIGIAMRYTPEGVRPVPNNRGLTSKLVSEDGSQETNFDETFIRSINGLSLDKPFTDQDFVRNLILAFDKYDTFVEIGVEFEGRSTVLNVPKRPM
ncbi:MAG: hypothetical protein SFX74_03590 [Fimbriimonadaceae bacterium]|nr:hypothetical protein [Fimbriimonadaceae bacterium]